MDSRLSSTFISHPLFLPPKIQKSSIFFPKHLSIYRHRPLVLKQREIEVINGSSSPRLFVGVSMLGSPLDHCILGEGASSSKGDFLPNLEEPRMEAIEVSPRKKVERERMSGEGKVVCVTGASGFIASWPAKHLLQRGYTVKATVRDLSDPTSGEGKVVCVTGASGFIASWLAKRLLERGYTVKATVRDLSDPRKTEHLLALDGAKDRLQLFKADLLEEGSFDSVIEGCDGVFHTASPVVFSVTNPQDELIDPALRGTLNVLKSCSKVPSIKRVVFTSSMAAVCHDRKPISPDAVVDETWFSDPDYCEKTEQWYDLSKALAEEAAWNFARENGIDLVTINPGVVIGPLLQPNLNYSVEIILKIIDGTERLENYRFVDIRDVADAHIQAFEIPSASGRYCLVERAVPCSETLQILQELYPSLHFPEKFEDVEWNAKYNVSQEKMKSLGISYIPLETSLKDTIESLKERNLIRI